MLGKVYRLPEGEIYHIRLENLPIDDWFKVLKPS